MPRFIVLVEGRGLEAPTHKGDPIRGFFVRRVVQAADAPAAGDLAAAAIHAEWVDGAYAKWQATPEIAVAEVKPAGFFSRFTVPRKYFFHRGK